MKLLAVVVNYRSSQFLTSCLASLGEAGVERVSVVDNFSDERERELVREAVAASDVPVTLSLLDSNAGFGPGVNRAVEALGAAPEDLIWIVNPDAEVSNEAARSLVAVFDDDRADLVSPLILTGARERPVVWFAGGEIQRRSGRTQHLHLAEDSAGLSGLHDVSFVTGAAPLIRASAFAELGGFREDLFLYWEDADLSDRATALGLRLAVDLDAVVWHAVGGSGDSHGKSAVYYRYMQRNRMLVASGWSSRWNLLLRGGAVETLKLLARPLKERRGRREKFAAGFGGLREGFRLAGSRRSS
ncbi:glycosyltransferase family 2 protein [Pseudoclavibacter sp. RFBA6]|uniref:glycosyltransferase family 2 protein n=1 Tax=Pseudoclavibacter sp. RFBA6 TaxID=2080573 RepID=UPI000CE8FED3|nr:glycosyltransferase family 2 protein [Pseudoclavibacter sp. RFBA6]PPG43390.1 hypothetical protein C5C17_02230 [Pseudoclavibacter sp. RFBA6]